MTARRTEDGNAAKGFHSTSSGKTAPKTASLWAEIVSLLCLVDLAIICSPESESRRDCLNEQTHFMADLEKWEPNSMAPFLQERRTRSGGFPFR
jgi:hypothetical protein